MAVLLFLKITMIWNILTAREIEVDLPINFNKTTMYPFINAAIDEQLNAKCSKIYFNFSKLEFINPTGIVVLSNLIEFFKKAKVKVLFKGHRLSSEANQYLDDSGFFRLYLNKNIFHNSSQRATTMPLELVKRERTTEFLHYSLIPWVSRQLNLANPKSLDSLRTCIEEVFQNINDHSGVGIGCTFTQFYPRDSKIQIAISDFGLGIPTVVRSVEPDLLDHLAIKKASEEGFTTKSNVRNRGAGLAILIDYVTLRSGTVMIASGKGELSAVMGSKGTKVTARTSDGHYPGTLVRIILNTRDVKKFSEDVESEEFEWSL